MATQQVKFHSVTQGAYAEIAAPSDGSLYFITDNGEIRKGSNHVTGTRVYTATDSTGTTAVDDLTVLFNGTSIESDNFPADDLPKKGDILMVEHTLVEGVAAQGEQGEEGYVPAVPPVKEYATYVYEQNGGAYSTAGWVGCVGNVDASKVILTQNITMAGNYTNVGNVAKSSNTSTGTFETQGKSVAAAFQEIFTKRLQPGTPGQPAVTLKINNANANYSTSAEVGTTVNIPNYSATLSAGSYTYNSTGITATAWSVTETKNSSTQTTSSGSLPSLVADDISQTYTVTATATHGAGNTPTDNLGDPATSVSAIAAGSKSASHTVTVNGYRKSFYVVLPPEMTFDPDDENFLSGNYVFPGTDLTLDSDFLRTAGGFAHSVVDSDANLSSIQITKYDGTTNPTGEGPFANILIFRPASANQNKKLLASTKDGLPYIKAPGALPIEGTISVNGANDIMPANYSCWVISTGDAPVDSDTVSLSWV